MKECPQTLDFEDFEDNTEVIRIRKSKDRRYNGQKKKYKGQTIIYKTLDIEVVFTTKLQILKWYIQQKYRY